MCHKIHEPLVVTCFVSRTGTPGIHGLHPFTYIGDSFGIQLNPPLFTTTFPLSLRAISKDPHGLNFTPNQLKIRLFCSYSFTSTNTRNPPHIRPHNNKENRKRYKCKKDFLRRDTIFSNFFLRTNPQILCFLQPILRLLIFPQFTIYFLRFHSQS